MSYLEPTKVTCQNDVAEPTKSVLYQLSLIDEELINLQSVCVLLRDRLQFITTENNVNEKEPSDHCVITCELHGTLRSFTDKIISRKKDIFDIISRLEI